MAIPWMIALKVIPWGDVIEHAPKVLNAARQLLDRQRQGKPEAAAPSVMDETPYPAASPEVRELQQQLAATRDDLARLQQTQEQIAQTLADLAEQNTRLVGAVDVLRRRTRWLMVLVAMLIAAGLWWAWR
jgi:hypothetical protein